MKISLSKLCNNKLFIFIGLVCAIRPEYFGNQIPIVDTILGVISSVYFPIIIALYYLSTISNRGKYASAIVNLIFCLQSVLLLSTIINSGEIYTGVKYLLYVVGFCVFTDCMMRYNVKGFIDGFYWLLLIYVTLNFITILQYPEGIWYSSSLSGNEYYLQHWFLSAKNNFIVYILPAMCIAIMRCYMYHKVFITTIWLLIISSLSVFITFSATSIVAIIVFWVYLILVHKNKLLEWFHYPHYLIATALIFLAIVVFRLQNYFSFIIENLLGKSLDLTGRTETWDWAIYWIKQMPIIGSGYEDNYTITAKLHDTAATHCHNMFLDVTYRGGFIALIIFISILIICIKKEKKYRKNKVTCILVFSIFLFTGILFLTEAYFNQRTFFMLMVMLYDIEYIVCDAQSSWTLPVRKRKLKVARIHQT